MAARKYISDPRYLRPLEEVFDLAIDGVSPPGTAEAGYESVMVGTAPAEPAHLNARTLSMFLHDAAARGTPMEPNFLKNTEIHVISRPLSGISDRGFVAHYLRFNHSLELRADIDLPEDFLEEGIVREGWFFVGLSTAFTPVPRPRAFTTDFESVKALDRNIELGHAVGSVALAAATLGWEARLLGPSLAFVALKRLLGLQREADLLNEMPAAAILLFRRPPDNPDGAVLSMRILNSKIIRFFNESIQWRGCPRKVNALANPADCLSRFLIKTQWTGGPELVRLDRLLPAVTAEYYEYTPGATLRRALSSRGSNPAADFDENYCTPLLDFRQFVLRCCPYDLSEADAGGRGACFPHGTLPWPPRVNVFFYVNRVEGLDPGLYCVVRNRWQLENICIRPRGTSYLWKPIILSHRVALGAFYLLRHRNGLMPSPSFKTEHKNSSFIVAMAAPFSTVIEETTYMNSRETWEAGFLGEVLAVEAQAQGVSTPMIPTKDYHNYFNGDRLETAMGIENTSGRIICAYAVGKDKQCSIPTKVLTALCSLCPWAAFRNFLAVV